MYTNGLLNNADGVFAPHKPFRRTCACQPPDPRFLNDAIALSSRENECDKIVTSTLLVTPTRYGRVIKHLIIQEKTGRGEKMDSRLRHSVLRTALRASVGSQARLGANFRPLPPEYSATPVCNQDITEYH